jgi:hypothetical protein
VDHQRHSRLEAAINPTLSSARTALFTLRAIGWLIVLAGILVVGVTFESVGEIVALSLLAELAIAAVVLIASARVGFALLAVAEETRQLAEMLRKNGIGPE